MNRIVIEEHHDLCIHAYEAWVVIREEEPPEMPSPKMLRVGRVTVSVSPFAALNRQPSIVDISHELALMNCQYPGEQSAYAEAIFRLGKIAGDWEIRRQREAAQFPDMAQKVPQ